MSFARALIHGQQELPINDTYVYFPVQVLQSLVNSISQNHYEPVKPVGGLGYRMTRDQRSDNPYLVVGAYRKTLAYEGEPALPDTFWAARAYESGALDPTLGQSMSFPSSAKMTLRTEVPLWSDVAAARHLPPQKDADESDADSSITGTQEQTPRLAEPVPNVADEALPQPEEPPSEEEDQDAEPSYLHCPKGSWTLCLPLYPPTKRCQ